MKCDETPTARCLAGWLAQGLREEERAHYINNIEQGDAKTSALATWMSGQKPLVIPN
jgi:hypothetical protein